MLNTLELLVELQKIDDKIDTIDQLLISLPEQIKRHSANMDAAKLNFDNFQKEIDDKKKSRLKKEKDVEDKIEAVAKAKNKLHEIKTNQEYTAALKEIDNLTNAVAVLEDEQLELMEEVDASAGKLAELKKLLTAEEKLFSEIKAENDARIEEVKAEKETIVAKRSEIYSRVDASYAKKYDSLLKSRAGKAISELKEGICTVCNTTVRPQMIVEINTGSAIHTCPSCSRFLYSAKLFEPAS